MGALLQHITYTEWVPLVVGGQLAQRHGLRPLQTGHFTGYSPNVDATIANVFATGAMRHVHTQVSVDEVTRFLPE